MGYVKNFMEKSISLKSYSNFHKYILKLFGKIEKIFIISKKDIFSLKWF